MITTDFTSKSYNEVIFEQRNKNYGAYILRRSYNDHVIIAFFITILCFSVLTCTLFFFRKNNYIPKANILPEPELFFLKIFPKKYSTPPEEKSKQDNPKKNIENKEKNNSSPIVKNDDKQEEREDKNKSSDKSNTEKGPNGADTIALNTVELKNEKEGSTSDKTSSGETKKWAEVMPRFPGGDMKLREFILRNLAYPKLAVEEQITGIVGVSFVVDTSGIVTQVNLLNHIGGGCDEEAMRVVKMMPKWNPGMNHGKPVRVEFNLPIKFALR